jgi:hypothetical protein
MTQTETTAPSTPSRTLLGCLLEVLACFRPDPTLANELHEIIEDPDDRVVYPTPAPRIVPRTWLIARAATTGTLIGTFCAAATTMTLATLRPAVPGSSPSIPGYPTSTPQHYDWHNPGP